MKKIVMGAAALLCAASMFAVDFAAKVQMAGSIAKKNGDNVDFITLDKKDQKDADALVISASTDKAGANFQFWYNYCGGAAPEAKTTADKNEDGSLTGTFTTAFTPNSIIQVRSVKLWFKPIDQLKVTVGDVSCGIFGEKLHYWKDPCGNDYASASSWDHGYSSYATVEGAGIAAELTPIDGLTVVAGIAAGCDTNFISFVENVSTVAVKAYGVSAAYNLSSVADLPVTIGVSWRDEGTDAIKILAIGADYGNAFAEGFYGMLNARMFFSQKVGSATVSATGKDYKMTGIAFDNFFRFKTGAMTIDLRAPIILRGLAGQTVSADGVATALNETNDPSYMYLSAKFSYALDGLTIYVGAGSDYDDSLNGWVFNKDFGDNFNLTIHPGVTFNVGACAFDIGARFDIKDAVASTTNANAKYHPFAWSIPFTATIGF